MRRADIEVPNPTVDVNSWVGSACYPRGSFYPLSHGPPTRTRRITRPGFRPCSACPPRSQAPLCPCAHWVMSIHPEGTIGRLRYPLGGDRPSQTAPLARFPAPLQGSGVGTSTCRSGISPSAPPDLATRVQRLPPILHEHAPVPMPGCSKAPRGLFVLSRDGRIFTAAAISPGPLSRQRPSRYAIRAGRNLPDKEFRYLRTVIVTAAVYWGFGSDLAALPLTFQHWAGVSPYTSTPRVSRDLCFW
jgi:hypothetical protein